MPEDNKEDNKAEIGVSRKPERGRLPKVVSLVGRLGLVLGAIGGGAAGGIGAGKLGLIEVRGNEGQITGPAVVRVVEGQPSLEKSVPLTEVKPVNIAAAGITKDVLDKEFKDVPTTKIIINDDLWRVWQANTARLNAGSLDIVTAEKSKQEQGKEWRAIIISNRGHQFPISYFWAGNANQLKDPNEQMVSELETNRAFRMSFQPPRGVWITDEIKGTNGGLRLLLQRVNEQGIPVPGSSQQFEIVRELPVVTAE